MSSVGNNKMISGMAGEELLDIEAAILLTGMVDLESLRTPFLNQAAYDRLIDAVAEAVAANESVPQFSRRLSAMGKDVVFVAKRVLDGLWE